MIVFQYFSQNYKLFCDSVLLKAFKADQSLYRKVLQFSCIWIMLHHPWCTSVFTKPPINNLQWSLTKFLQIRIALEIVFVKTTLVYFKIEHLHSTQYCINAYLWLAQWFSILLFNLFLLVVQPFLLNRMNLGDTQQKVCICYFNSHHCRWKQLMSTHIHWYFL